MECGSCGYPITSSVRVGQQVACPMCNTINEAISQVAIPTPLFVGVIAFLLGMLLGPPIVATTDAGQKWLERTAREKIG